MRQKSIRQDLSFFLLFQHRLLLMLLHLQVQLPVRLLQAHSSHFSNKQYIEDGLSVLFSFVLYFFLAMYLIMCYNNVYYFEKGR